MNRHTIIVRGSGPFPDDMLRYDECHFFSDADWARACESSERAIAITKLSKFRSLRQAFTFDRWKSFGWVVENGRITKEES